MGRDDLRAGSLKDGRAGIRRCRSPNDSRKSLTKTHIATQKVETLQVRLPKQFKLLNLRQQQACAIFMEVCSARGTALSRYTASLNVSIREHRSQRGRKQKQVTAVHGSGMGWQSSRYRAALHVPGVGSGPMCPKIILRTNRRARGRLSGIYETVKKQRHLIRETGSCRGGECYAGATMEYGMCTKVGTGGRSCNGA